MIKLVSVSEMIAIENEANSIGLSYKDMMENAGRGLAEVIIKHYGNLKDDGILGLVGSGNNGGDTLVALTYLAELGWNTSVYIINIRPKNDMLVSRFKDSGGEVYYLQDDHNYKSLEKLLFRYAILLDGVLGTGTKLPLRDALARVLDYVKTRIRTSGIHPVIIAVDNHNIGKIIDMQIELRTLMCERSIFFALSR